MALTDYTPLGTAVGGVAAGLLGIYAQSRRSRPSRGNESVASWSQLNNALNKENKRLREIIEKLESRIETMEAEAHGHADDMRAIREDMERMRRRMDRLDDERVAR